MVKGSLSEKIVQLRWVIIIGFIAITVFFARQLPKLEIDPELKRFLPEDLPSRVSTEKIEELLGNEGIIRNRLKITSSIQNAKAFIKIQQEFGSFNTYIWEFVGGKPKLNKWQKDGDIPATSPESDAMSKDLKNRGFSFVGSTICYAFMQAVGMVNDHTVDCFRYKELC